MSKRVVMNIARVYPFRKPKRGKEVTTQCEECAEALAHLVSHCGDQLEALTAALVHLAAEQVEAAIAAEARDGQQ